MKRNKLPTQARVKELFDYDPESGLLAWKVTRSRAIAGHIAGVITNDGYRQIGVDGKVYKAANIVWLWVTGKWAAQELDHCDTIRCNDRFDNLREASRREQIANRKPWAKCLKGVKAHRNKWEAAIGRGTGKTRTYHYLGTFDCPAAAHFAYIIAAHERHGQFVRTM